MTSNAFEVNTKKETVLYRSTVILVGALFLSLVYGSIALAYIMRDHDALSQEWPGMLLACVLIGIAIGAIGWSIYHLIVRKPLLVLDKEGVYTRTTGKVLWDDTENVSLSYTSYALPTISPAIVIHLKNRKVVTLSLQLSMLQPAEVYRLFKVYQGTQ